VKQIVTGQFTTGLVQQSLKRDAMLGEAALQGSSAQVQLSREVLYPRTLTGEQLLQNAFCLLSKTLACKLLRQFCLKLWRDGRQQISVVSYTISLVPLFTTLLVNKARAN
jgi:hypothetical protein